MDYQLESEIAIVEAVLFLENEPVSIENLVIITQLSEDVVESALEKLKERYASPLCGLELVFVTGGWALSPKKELWSVLKDRYGKQNGGKLSKSAMETLSIIAYQQPITRAEIEAIRGVSADNMVRLLLERKLICEKDRKDIPGKPIQYGTTKEFLKFFGLNSIADLPKLDETESERFELAR